jgi:hypothetical protein
MLAVFPALAAAQTSPPPAQPSPPAAPAPPPTSPAPAYPPPPGSSPPAVNQPPPPGYEQPPPGYQQRPPPPGYEQPPPGYQAPPPAGQPPPGYQAPPPGTYQPPPPRYYQPPPAGTYQSPPGYRQAPPPPGYQAPPPGYQAPPPPGPPPRTHGFLALPYLGAASRAGDSGNGLGPGPILGALIGGRVNPTFSLNGELRIDVINFHNLAPGEQVAAAESELVFSPLFHVQFQAGEFVVGPKFGFFSYGAEDTIGGVSKGKTTASGETYGINAGVFFAVSRIMSLGGMVSYTVRDPSKQCVTPAGGAMDCQNGNYPAEDILGFHAGMLF